MKKLTILALVFVLTVCVLSGCRKGSGEITSEPTMTTTPETTASTAEPTTSAPTTNMPTDDTGTTNESMQPGNNGNSRGIMN